MASYRQALEIDPSLTAAYLNLGIILSRGGNYAQAEQQLLKAVKQDPGYAKAYYNLGLVYAEQANPDSALSMLQRAIELDRDYSLARLAEASVYYEMLELDKAESLLVLLRDDTSLGGQGRSQIESLLRAIPERRAWTETRRSGRQRESDRYLVRGDNLLSLGLTERARQAYLKAIDIDERSGIAHYQLGTLYFNSGKPDEALKHFDAALRATPSLKGAHFARGVIAFRKGDITAACREFEEELRIDPRSSASHINLAMCYEEHVKDLGQAAYHLSEYIELTGGTDEIRKHLKELEDRLEDER
jgi:superkiller protein 3